MSIESKKKVAKNSELTLGAVADAYEALAALGTKELPGEISAKIVRLSQKLQLPYVRYVELRRIEAEKYGTKDGDKIQITSEKMVEYQQAMVPIRAELVELTSVPKLNRLVLSAIQISPQALTTLIPFIEDFNN